MSIAMASACAATSSAKRPTDPVLARGQDVFGQNCATCHGADGEGGKAPPLIGIVKTYPDINRQIAIVINGVKGTEMVAWGPKLSADDINAVVRYTRESLAAPENSPSAQDNLPR